MHTMKDSRGPTVCELAANADERRRGYNGNWNWDWVADLEVSQDGARLEAHVQDGVVVVFAPQSAQEGHV